MGSYAYFENDELFSKNFDYSENAKIGTNNGPRRIFNESGVRLNDPTDVFCVYVAFDDYTGMMLEQGVYRSGRVWALNNALSRLLFNPVGNRKVRHVRLVKLVDSLDHAFVGGSTGYTATPPSFQNGRKSANRSIRRSRTNYTPKMPEAVRLMGWHLGYAA